MKIPKYYRRIITFFTLLLNYNVRVYNYRPTFHQNIKIEWFKYITVKKQNIWIGIIRSYPRPNWYGRIIGLLPRKWVIHWIKWTTKKSCGDKGWNQELTKHCLY